MSEKTAETEKLLKSPQSQTAWGGLTTYEGSPIFGRTTEGFKFGTPKFKEATVKELYTPALTGEEGYLPVGKTELALAQKNVMSEYAPETQKLIGQQLELRGITFGTKSAFIKPELSIKEVTEGGHGLKPETTKNIIKYLKKQSDIKVEGSTGQSAQMKVSRGMHDLDISVKDKLKTTEELLTLIEKTEGKGVVIRKSPTTAGLSTKKGGTLFDIHDINVSPSESLYGSSQSVGNMLKFGFKAEPTIKIGGIKTQALSEQATAKMGSTIMLRKPIKWGVDLTKLETLPEVSPSFHRAKDIVDIFKIEPTLIESQKKGAFAFLKKGKIAKAESLAKDVEKSWTERVKKYDVTYTSRDLGGKKTTMASDFEKTMKKYAEGTPEKETIYSKTPKQTKSAIEVIKDYSSKMSKGVASSPKSVFPNQEYKSNLKSSRFSLPSKVSGYELMSIDIPLSKPSSKSRVSKSSDLLSLSIPSSKPYSPSKSYESKSKPSELSKPSKPSTPSIPSTTSITSTPYRPYTPSPDFRVGKPLPPIFGGVSGFGGMEFTKFDASGKRLKIHKIPSPEELFGFGQTKGKKYPKLF